METKSGWWKIAEGLGVPGKDQGEEWIEGGGGGKRRVNRHHQCMKISL